VDKEGERLISTFVSKEKKEELTGMGGRGVAWVFSLSLTIFLFFFFSIFFFSLQFGFTDFAPDLFFFFFFFNE
jgi:hypothetical protein